MITQDNHHWLSIQEAADYLRVHRSAIRHGIARGRMFRLAGVPQPPPPFEYDYFGELRTPIEELRSYAIFYADYFDGLRGTAVDPRAPELHPYATAKERNMIESYRKKRLAKNKAPMSGRALYTAAAGTLERIVGRKPSVAGPAAIPHLPAGIETAMRRIKARLGNLMDPASNADIGCLSTKDSALYLGIGIPYLRLLRSALGFPMRYTKKPPIQVQLSVPLVRELKREVFRDTPGIRPADGGLTLSAGEAEQLEKLRAAVRKRSTKPRQERIDPVIRAAFQKTLRPRRRSQEQAPQK